MKEQPSDSEYRAYVREQIQSLTETLTKVMFGDFTAVARTPEPDEAFGYLCAMINVAINAARSAQDELGRTNSRLKAEVVERRRAEKEVGESRELLQAITDNAAAVIYVKDLEGRYLIVNRLFSELFHISREDVVGKTDHDLFAGDMADAFRAMDQRVVAAGRALIEEEVAPHDDGPHTYMSVKCPLRGSHGRIRGVFGISTDITDRKRAEEAFRDSEAQTRSIVDTALDAVVTMDGDGLITGWNPQAEGTFGWTSEEAVGRSMSQTIIPLLYRDSHSLGLRRYLATGEGAILGKRLELSALHCDGREFPVELSVTAIGTRQQPAFSAFVRDLTERRAREEQLRQLQRMDAIGRLTGGVAHDFNNLLAIINGNAELVRDRMEEGSDAAEMIDEVLGAAGRGGELVRRLLAYARMQHLDPEAVDLNARLPNIISLLHRVLGENITVRPEPGDGLWHANVDSTRVYDAIVNLAINARDAMPDGGTLTIETQNISLDEDYAANHVEVTPGDYVMLAVSDTGTGMSPEVVARAFEPFFTTKEEGKGTGLGLSQVFGWVKQSGGHIKIYSELGHGTTIKLYLPRAKGQAEEKVAEPEAATPKGDETIFVVEDNPNVRRTVIRQLHDLGYQTIEADSGAEAMRMVRDGASFDLLLTDVVMPGGMTGYQLADELRAERPDVRVLFTSGYTELASSNGSSAGSDPLLSKPYRTQDLARSVRAAIDAPSFPVP